MIAARALAPGMALAIAVAGAALGSATLFGAVAFALLSMGAWPVAALAALAVPFCPCWIRSEIGYLGAVDHDTGAEPPPALWAFRLRALAGAVLFWMIVICGWGFGRWQISLASATAVGGADIAGAAFGVAASTALWIAGRKRSFFGAAGITRGR